MVFNFVRRRHQHHRRQHASSFDVITKASGGALHAVSSTIIRPIPKTAAEESHAAANVVLDGLGLPFGLRQVLLGSLDRYAKRIWIVDNSGRCVAARKLLVETVHTH